MMHKIYTIGTSGKTAEQFFEILKRNEIDLLLDVRLKASSQLNGFTKGGDKFLGYLTTKITNAKYVNDLAFAPTKDILENYKKKVTSWEEYVLNFKALLLKRKISEYYKHLYLTHYKNVCLLCSESKPEFCHRSLVANELMLKLNVEIKHL